jgi:hypothetical protein
LIVVAEPTAAGFRYRVDWAYHSWADTVVRPKIARRDLSAAAARLDALERGAVRWRLDTSGLSSALRMSGDTPSTLAPEQIVGELRNALA